MTEIPFRRRGHALSAAFAASALVLFGAAGCEGAGTAIARLTVGDPGPDPYAPAKGTDQRLTSAGGGAAVPGGTLPGDSPGLYGGTRREGHCDMDRLVMFLQAHPDRAGAWASVLRIAPREIAAFVTRLTPVHLRADTLVTNHGFRAGKATGAPAVLEAGMGVLINEYGVPVVKCNCGNPLTPADPKLSLRGSRYTGPAWPDFHAGKVTRIQPGRAPAQGFVLSAPDGGGAFARPRGTRGGADGPRVPEPPIGTPLPRAAHHAPPPFSAESHFSPAPPPPAPQPPPAQQPPSPPSPGLPRPVPPSGKDSPTRPFPPGPDTVPTGSPPAKPTASAPPGRPGRPGHPSRQGPPEPALGPSTSPPRDGDHTRDFPP
ncbi:DUF6777 domain-containing protein [Spirillospora sp. NPDC049652]